MTVLEKIKTNIYSMSLIEIEKLVEENRDEILKLLGEDLDGYSSSEKRDMLETLIVD